VVTNAHHVVGMSITFTPSGEHAVCMRVVPVGITVNLRPRSPPPEKRTAPEMNCHSLDARARAILQGCPSRASTIPTVFLTIVMKRSCSVTTYWPLVESENAGHARAHRPAAASPFNAMFRPQATCDLSDSTYFLFTIPTESSARLPLQRDEPRTENKRPT